MIYREQNGCAWLEFEQFQPYKNLFHAVSLKGFSCPLPSFSFVELKQTHGTDIHEIQIPPQEELLGDALTTKQSRLGLAIRHADCQAALFYDPKKKAIAAVHSGWRGSTANIYGKMIHFMKERFGSLPEDLLVCIGPSLGPSSAEFIHYEKELPATFLPFQIKPTYFDFWSISQHQLKAAGVPEKQIEVACLDTFQDALRFHSYRRDKTVERHRTFLALL